MAVTALTGARARFGVDGEIVWHALGATRAAALAAAAWSGRGDAKSADGAATDAMREAFASAQQSGVVVSGEGAKDGAPMLADGEHVGLTHGECEFDLAVDPLECTDLCAWGLRGALSTVALSPRGTMWSPGPAYYMDKLVVSPRARSAARLTDPPEVTVANVADALCKQVSELRIVVLDKPRHVDLVARLRATGASVSTPTAGDVAGALDVLLGSADLLLGIGGTPEGVLGACAVRALGGGMQGRIAPQREDERVAVERAGLSTTQVLELDELIAGDATFIATGVTGGLLAAPRRRDGWLETESIVIAGGVVHRISTQSKE